MAHRVRQLGAVIAGTAAAVALAGCGEPPRVVAESVTSQTASHKDKTPGPTAVQREVQELTGFISPSGNVACMLDATWARCDIIDRNWSPPPRPPDCEFDYGQGISLAPGERAQFVCAGDTAFGADQVLPYGESIAADRLRCESAQSGITCLDSESGHGFSISREAYRVF
ncbi:DUF6636 domain-containing protein [Mycobacterium deserti]|uniref:Lipoprotein LppU n=1 Tax=Mycobacterium deserti TaxID=2978347 RepID=A0ABT2MBF6_9MYCO|nr:DUF6636 domain-containing protein [Mycobacterium deserti]MCT7659592.1 hypothetical protein [Mycobacterium deserti]